MDDFHKNFKYEEKKGFDIREGRASITEYDIK